MSESGANSELGALEAALRALQPAPADLNRDTLMFRAGQASMPRQRWTWPAATAALFVATIGLSAAHFWRATAEPQERIVYVTLPPTADAVHSPAQNNQSLPEVSLRDVVAASEPTVSPLSYVQLREQVARHGVDAMPEAPRVMSRTPSTGEQPQSWRKSGDEPFASRF